MRRNLLSRSMQSCVKERGDFMNYNSRRLSEYTQVNKQRIEDHAMGSMLPIPLANVTNDFGAITLGYNNQYQGFLDILGARRDELAQTVHMNLSQNPDYMRSRNAGVKLAWQYEKADIEMGGSGSANWTKAEQDEILNSKTGTVSGAEGHHQKNVVDHPEYQADPDNIKFYKSRQEHLQQGHDGNFQNESDAPFIDKNRMLEKTNNHRVLVNEIKGASISAAIGFGIACTISAISELARVGISSVEMGDFICHSLRAGIEGGTISTVIYGAGRMVSTFLQNQGVDLLTHAGALVNFAAVGTVSIVLVSTYQFIKMKTHGMETSVVFKEIGKQMLFSLSVLAVSIIAQGAYGGYAGLIVSTSVGLLVLTLGVINTSHQRKLEEHIKEYAIEEYRSLIAI